MVFSTTSLIRHPVSAGNDIENVLIFHCLHVRDFAKYH